MDQRHQHLQIVEKMYDETAKSPDRMIAAHYAIDGKPFPSAYHDELFERIDKLTRFEEGDTVLEVGSGSGLLLEKIAPYIKKVVGTDISAEILKLTPNLANVSTMKMESDNLSFDDETFDKVICHGVIPAFPDLKYTKSAIADMIRVCRTGGKIYLGDIFNLSLKEIFLDKIHIQRPILERLRISLREKLRRMLGRPPAFVFEYLFIDPHDIEEWSREYQCQQFLALMPMGRTKPLLHRQFRYDVLIVK